VIKKIFLVELINFINKFIKFKKLKKNKNKLIKNKIIIYIIKKLIETKINKKTKILIFIVFYNLFLFLLKI